MRNFEWENLQKDFEFQHLIDDANFSMEFHCHDHIEIFLSISGGKSFIIDDKIYDMKPGDLFVNNQFEVHRTVAVPDVRYERYVLSFHQEFLQMFCTPESNLMHYVYRRPKEFSNKISLSASQLSEFMQLAKHYEELDEKEFAVDVQQKLIFVEMLTLTARYFLEKPDSDSSISSAGSMDTIAQVLEYITAHLTDELSLDVIARQIGISKFHLCKIFKAKTGTTINKYIVTRRISEAKQLLLQGIPVTEVSYLAGFGDLSHFIRTFHNEVGVSPGKYVESLPSYESNYYIGAEREK